MSKKYVSVQALAAEEKRIEAELAYTSTCKNTGKTKIFDYSKKAYANRQYDILSVWVWATYKRRYAAGNESQTSWYDRANIFFGFLREYGVTELKELDSRVFVRFVEWLKNHPTQSYSVAGSLYRALRPLFEQMGRHPRVSVKFDLPKNAFPKSTSLAAVDLGYDKNEMKQILKAVAEALREKRDAFESEYIPLFLGKPAPLDDVAELNPKTGTRSLWASHEHRVWFFENVLQCKPITLTRELEKFQKGQQFRNSFLYHPRKEYQDIHEFYEFIGAGSEYKPKYLGKASPIKYLTPWKKREYIIWYWENKMDSQYYTQEECRLKFREFYTAMREHWGTPAQFFKSRNTWRWISASDLAPYYLMLIIRTGLNPSTIQGLTIDCLEVDPLNPDRKFISWKKYRSHKSDRTISEEISKNDTWAVSIIERVIKITSTIRTNQKELWISNENPCRTPSAFHAAYFRTGIKRIFNKRPIFSSNTGNKLDVVAKSFRPTMAWEEYLRTEDLRYLQTLLGHSKVSTTADYLRRVEDPLFRSRRALHQEAMFIGLTESKEKAKKYISESDSRLIAKDHKNGFYDGILNHCKDPLSGVAKGQAQGEMCDADLEVCQGCQNLVITPYDIKKYFCYISFHHYLKDVDEISQDEFDKATAYKKHFWQSYVLPKYPVALVEEIRQEAKLNPIDVWDPKSFEVYKS